MNYMFNAKVSIALLYAILFFGTITASIPNNFIDAKAIEEREDYQKSIKNESEREYTVKSNYEESSENQYSEYQTDAPGDTIESY